MKRNRWLIGAALLVLMFAAEGAALAQSKLDISGRTYTKWLWGNSRRQGSAYEFSNIPNDSAGINGQFTEIELFFDANVSKYVEVHSRIHSRFNQNFWTNFGGWGGSGENPNQSGSQGEFSPLSNQYIKLRGMQVVIKPGYSWLDRVQVGATDLGQFDPFVIGKIRYIDRDNANAVIASGNLLGKKLGYDFIRLSLPKLWAGPDYRTTPDGQYTGFHAQDAAYAIQLRYAPSNLWDVWGIYNYVNDAEVDATDTNHDNGVNLHQRYRNVVYGAKVGIHPNGTFDIRGSYYHSNSMTNSDLAPYASFSPVLYGDNSGDAWKLNVDINDPFAVGLSFKIEAFDIGSDYNSILAARRESDVLLTEGHDAAFALNDPDNSSYGRYNGNATQIGWGGWDGTAQQVATLNVDNAITDFDEPLAETVIGWKGVTIVPVYQKGDLTLQGEYTYLSYNTNWQNFGNPIGTGNSKYPTFEGMTGVLSFRSPYQPFQDRTTHIAALNAKYVIPVGKGIDFNAKIKHVKDTDDRMTDAAFLPNDTPPQVYEEWGFAADGNLYKSFSSLSDDDRDMKYWTYQVGVGYQFRPEFYAGLRFENYNVDLQDGNTAFANFNGAHVLASGKYNKNKLAALLKYNLGGAEFGLEYQYNFGSFDPNYGSGFVPYLIDGKPYFIPTFCTGQEWCNGGYPGVPSWINPTAMPLFKRDFSQQRLKAYLKVAF